MTNSIDALSESLQQASKRILATYPHAQRANEVWGWHYPPLNREDMANMLSSLSDTIQVNKSNIDIKKNENEINSLTAVVNILDSQLIPNIASNPQAGLSGFFVTVSYLTERIAFISQWQMVKGSKALPTAILRRLQEIQADIDSIVTDKDNLKDWIDQITAAKATADELPTNLQRLQEANKKMAVIIEKATENNGRINDSTEAARKQVEELTKIEQEAKTLIAQCEEAYRVTTSRGLAAAFDERATSLKNSMRLWVSLLTVTLIVGAVIGYIRVEQLSIALNAPVPDWRVIAAKMLLSILSIGPPVWLAWLSTKQIGQRFRLAEDYGFKASVARAYEGYRREAVKIDPSFVSRLFGAVLTRLEEAPVRFVDQETHGSPWEELRKKPKGRSQQEQNTEVAGSSGEQDKPESPTAAKSNPGN